MPQRAVLEKMAQKMDGAITHLRQELGGLRGGRASLSLLDHVRMDYYGTPTALKHAGNLSMPDGRLMTIQPWDPAVIPCIEKAIRESGLGLNPSNDGTVVRIPVPSLSEERRKEFVKICRKYGEDAKINIRNARREANDALKHLQKDAGLTEDGLRRSETDVQKVTDGKIHKADDLLKKKEEEILEI